jgi:ADP-ribose pyrophosphatase YjhB (NUDIX family)
MQDPARAARETWRVLADLVAEHGRLEVVHRGWECPPEARDRLLKNLGNGVVGGAGVLARRDDRRLLVRFDDDEGWSDPGVPRHPGEPFADCARRGARHHARVRVAVGDPVQAHVLYARDWTGRDPVPHPFVLFEGRVPDGARPEADGEATAVGWFTSPPDRLRYAELSELF